MEILGLIPELWELLLSDDPPDVLYHYTSPDGLLGIIQNLELWATSTMFMNDPSEVKLLGDDVEQEMIDRLGKIPRTAQRERDLLEQLLAEGRSRSLGLYAISFSTHSSDLAQWRAYGTSGGGYAIGFRTVYLTAVAEEAGFFLGRCIYDPSKRRQVAALILDAALREVPDEFANDHIHQARLNIDYALRIAGPLFKHEFFESESEWRLISLPFSQHKGLDAAFRVREGIIIPYSKFDLPRTAGRCRLDQRSEEGSTITVRAGPGREPGIRAGVAHMLMSSVGLHPAVFADESPYRATGL